MMQQQQSACKARTKMFIQAGGLLLKSGILEAFHIAPNDNLQDYHNQEKAEALLAFLTKCFEENEFDEGALKNWQTIGKQGLRSR